MSFSFTFKGGLFVLTLPKAITFDCYGTLIDWEKAIQQFFAESMDLKGFGNVDPLTLQTDWEEIQFHYIQEPYRPYRQVLRDTLRMAFNRYSIPYRDEEADEFAEFYGLLETVSRYQRCDSELQKLVKVALITKTQRNIAETGSVQSV